MIKIFYFVILLISSTTLSASEMDVKTISCETYLEKVKSAPAGSKQAQYVDFLHNWLLGYASAKAGYTKISGASARSFVLKLVDVCDAKNTLTIADAAEIAGNEVLKDNTESK